MPNKTEKKISIQKTKKKPKKKSPEEIIKIIKQKGFSTDLLEKYYRSLEDD